MYAFFHCKLYCLLRSIQSWCYNSTVINNFDENGSYRTFLEKLRSDKRQVYSNDNQKKKDKRTFMNPMEVVLVIQVV